MAIRQHSDQKTDSYQLFWLVIAAVPLVIQTALLKDWLTPQGLVLESPIGLFVLVLVAASLCILTSALVLRRAVRTATPELVGVGLFYMSVSAMPLAHGITTPGVLYGPEVNSATMGTAFWAVFVGVLAASPNLAPISIRNEYLPRFWRQWMAFWLVVIFGISIASISLPNTFPLFLPGGMFERIIAVISILGALALSYRQVRLAQVARHPGPLVISGGYAFVASSAILWFTGTQMYSIGFWSTHLLDIAGVFIGTISALLLYRKTDDVRDALESVLVADPLSALELGLEPLIHTYVADIEAKDPITRDHVIRTAELSLRVGEELGFSGNKLRHISLVGLLHDVGKLDVPDSVLKKPGTLTTEEFEVIKCHPAAGADRARESVLLAPLADGICSHHERVDGRGYPNGLAGDEIPIEARIVSVCDAYDAMTNTRQYRSGFGKDRAIAILREHQAAQWDTEVVDALLRVVARQPSVSPESQDELTPALDHVGRDGRERAVERIGCDCLPEAALSEDVEVG